MKIPQASTKAFAWPGVLLLVLAAGPTFAQQPSQDQINAVRQSCRSDFMANCSGVTPGGKDAIECLSRNSAKLSGVCKTAVGAIVAPPGARAGTSRSGCDPSCRDASPGRGTASLGRAKADRRTWPKICSEAGCSGTS